ncbi:DHS-like NAD/FAD-binding domain-containing protein [Copromyces sp. CBS 386.78]|nr:DHS-like NAD/FAD-binding domain-containing protein [Copromyces sp. CBS 386.78]
MAHTAHQSPKKEKFETPEVIDRKAKHLVVFTGAGISTSAGIPDFRGPEGVWTLMAQGRQATKKSVDTLQAIPTKTHMALVELQGRGILKGLFNQNWDGLHRPSGICAVADFYAVEPDNRPLHNHRIGRKYSVCVTEPLQDTIIHFSEDVPLAPWNRAAANCEKADLCLVLGSSLTVTPAHELPQPVGERAAAHRKDREKQHVTTNLVICNLQDTDLDHLCLVSDHRIFAKADELMQRVMHYLQLPIPEFRVRPRLIVERDIDANPAGGRHGVDEDNTTPASFLRTVKLITARGRPRIVKTEPFVLGWRGTIGDSVDKKTLQSVPVAISASEVLTLGLEFMGNYGESSCDILPSGAAAKQPRVVTRVAYKLAVDNVREAWPCPELADVER